MGKKAEMDYQSAILFDNLVANAISEDTTTIM